MPEYLAPGVYPEEISTGPVPIEGVSTSTAGFVGQTERGPITPRLVTSLREYERWYGGFVDPDKVSFLPLAIKGFFDNGGQRAYVARVKRVDDQPSTLSLGTDGDDLELEAVGPGDLHDRLFVRITGASRRDPTNLKQADPNRFRLSILFYSTIPPTPLVDPFDRTKLRDLNRREPDATEDWDDLSADPTSSDYVVTALKNSHLIRVTDGTTPGLPAQVGWTPFAGGQDGNQVSADDYVGETTLPTVTGLSAIGRIDEISIVCVPDEVNATLLSAVDRNTIQTAVVTQCEQLKDRIAVLQIERGQEDIGQIQPPVTSSYAAVYYPWLRVQKPGTSDTILLPPGGHVAGVYAGTDVSRGVHKAPANVELRGIINRDLPGDRRPLEFTVNKQGQDILNPIGINVIRDLRSDRRGIRVWGARTLSGDAQWKYVNVRRLFMFVEESIAQGVQWVVFEPNDEPTWDRVRRSITNFLTSVWQSGALMGTRAEDAFFVRCDRTTMGQQEIDNGQLICYIGMAPVKPAEFVILRFSQKTLDQTS